MSTTIKPCKCEHESQDKLHGKHLRVHNKTTKTEGWRCTVCGTKKEQGK